ncbi:hypothetical protein VP01_3501g3 [Puccinia sorghi]|uniref:Uncharacterized protein n=1 Tax=Puccinia sorghi TaxID=27349 RepID=A0A0L6UVN2_9BASI|nr:hypothetical protein VP01_3501g3 [Puccinia sorghi]
MTCTQSSTVSHVTMSQTSCRYLLINSTPNVNTSSLDLQVITTSNTTVIPPVSVPNCENSITCIYLNVLAHSLCSLHRDCASLLEKGWSKNRTFLGLSASQFQAENETFLFHLEQFEIGWPPTSHTFSDEASPGHKKINSDPLCASQNSAPSPFWERLSNQNFLTCHYHHNLADWVPLENFGHQFHLLTPGALKIQFYPTFSQFPGLSTILMDIWNANYQAQDFLKKLSMGKLRVLFCGVQVIFEILNILPLINDRNKNCCMPNYNSTPPPSPHSSNSHTLSLLISTPQKPPDSATPAFSFFLKPPNSQTPNLFLATQPNPPLKPPNDHLPFAPLCPSEDTFLSAATADTCCCCFAYKDSTVVYRKMSKYKIMVPDYIIQFPQQSQDCESLYKILLFWSYGLRNIMCCMIMFYPLLLANFLMPWGKLENFPSIIFLDLELLFLNSKTDGRLSIGFLFISLTNWDISIFIKTYCFQNKFELGKNQFFWMRGLIQIFRTTFIQLAQIMVFKIRHFQQRFMYFYRSIQKYIISPKQITGPKATGTQAKVAGIHVSFCCD